MACALLGFELASSHFGANGSIGSVAVTIDVELSYEAGWQIIWLVVACENAR